MGPWIFANKVGDDHEHREAVDEPIFVKLATERGIQKKALDFVLLPCDLRFEAIFLLDHKVFEDLHVFLHFCAEMVLCSSHVIEFVNHRLDSIQIGATNILKHFVLNVKLFECFVD